VVKRLLFIPLSILLLSDASAQIAGQYVFSFLKQLPSARMTGLSGSQIALRDDDLAMGYQNPAHLNPLMHNRITYNQDFLLGGIKTGYLGYGYHIEKLKTTFQGGIQFVSYGTFKQTDEFDNINGEFKASEYAITLGAGRQINERLSVGLNLKYITSQLETYQSTGLAADLSGAYWDEEKKWGASVIFKNMGTQLSTYNERKEDLPLDIQIGFTKKLKKAPFRFSLLLHDINRWNLRYDSPLENETTLLGEESKEPSRLSREIDNFFRHINFGGELIIGKTEVLRIRGGYNHQMRKELNITNVRSLSGFSVGFGFKISRFRIDYGLGRQHLAGGMNHLSISTHFSEFKKK
jgi:hypothetical protein